MKKMSAACGHFLTDTANIPDENPALRRPAVHIEIKRGDTMTFYRVFERGSGTFQPR